MKLKLSQIAKGAAVVTVFSSIFTANIPARADAPSQTPQTPAAILAEMQKVADWQLANPAKASATDWTQAAGYTGFMALAGISPDPKYLQAMLDLGEKTHWKLGPRKYMADDHAVAQTYLELYARYHEKKMLEPTRADFDFILSTPPANRDDLDFKHKDATDKWSWCDSLFMAPPAWARLYAVTGDKKYLDYMDEHFWHTTDFLYDKKQHLFYRDSTYFAKHEPNGQPVFWGRGNGWVIAGIARVLQVMPDNYPSRPKYVALFKDMAERLRALQDAQGAWHPSLLDPQAYPEAEMSSTGFIDYALAWGVNTGILDRATFEPAALKGWSALVNHVQPDGMLGSVQPVGADPKHIKPTATAAYGTGAFLLAGSEIYKLELLKSQPHVTVSVRNPLDLYRFSQMIQLNSGEQLSATAKPDDLMVISGETAQILDSQSLTTNSGAAKNALIFQTDIAPNATQTFFVVAKPADLKVPAPIVKTFARYVPERQDDFAWENDRIAHRIYGPTLAKKEGTNNSGIDVWVKSVRRLVVDERYAKDHQQSYHSDHGNGLDDYENGTSRGDGGTGIWSGDTFYVSNNYATQKVIASGPIRCEFEVTYAQWNAGGKLVSETKRFSLDAGSNFTKIVDTYTAQPPEELNIGIALLQPNWAGRFHHNRKPTNLQRTESAAPTDILGSEFAKGADDSTWYADWEDETKFSNDHGHFNKPSINGETGVGIIVPNTAKAQYGFADGHWMMNLQVQSGVPVSYYVGAGWSKGDFADAAAWHSYVRDFAASVNAPLQISVR